MILIGLKWQRILSQCHGHVTSTQKFTIIMNIIIIIRTIKRHIWEMSSKWNISLVWLGITSKLIIQWGAHSQSMS